MTLQVFQLTTLLLRGPTTHGETFVFCLDCVPIKEEEVRGVLLCVQGFVWSSPLTQRSFFSVSGLRMLSESVAIADRITSSPVYAPWSIVETTCGSQLITDLRACWNWVVLRHRTAKDTSERFHYGGTPRSETAARPEVRVSDVVEEGCVEYVPVASPALGPPGPSKILSSPSSRKRSPMRLLRKFEISSPPVNPQRQSLVEDPSFASALAAQASRGKSSRSGRDRCAAPVFQMGFP